MKPSQRSGRLLAALAAGVLIVGSAPILGRVRDTLLDAFGVRFLGVLAIGLAVVGLAVFGAALWRIRDDRARRYALLAGAAALVAFQVWHWQSGDRRVDLVERVHLLEYGSLALLFHRAFQGCYRGWILAGVTLLSVGVTGVLDELVQWWSPIRTGDQRDVWLNLYAGVIGLLVAFALAPPMAAAGRLQRTTLRPLFAVLTLFVGSFGLLIEVAHLGYAAGDDPIRFRSFFPAERLLALAAERAARWSVAPPVLSPYAMEDFYLTEAAWHVQARNAAWDAGDMTDAWVENRILEQWYAPFLDLKSFRTGVPHRWPASQRMQVEAAPRNPLPNNSEATWSLVLADRVWIGPPAKRIRWALVASFCVSLLAWALSYRPASRPSGRP